MGMFDYVRIDDDWCRCSEGHDLRDREFQTKDLDNDLETFVVKDGQLRGRPKFTGELFVYTTCPECHDCWIEFQVDVADGQVTSTELVSPTTAAAAMSAAILARGAWKG